MFVLSCLGVRQVALGSVDSVCCTLSCVVFLVLLCIRLFRCLVILLQMRNEVVSEWCISSQIQNPFLTAQSTQIKSVISVPIKDFIHHYHRALFNDIPRVGAHFYDIPGSGRTFTTYPGRGAV